MTFAWQTFASLRLFTCLFTLARIACLLHFCVKTSRFPLLYLSHAQLINVNQLLPILFPDATARFPYDRHDSLEKKKFSDRSDHMETTFQRSHRQRSLRQNFSYLSDRCRCDRYASMESGFLVIAAIAEIFFLSDRSDHMETRLKLRIFTK